MMIFPNGPRRVKHGTMVSFEHNGLDFVGGVGLRHKQYPAGPDGAYTAQPRFTKADNGVITDHLTALDWYVAPTPTTMA